MASRRGTADEYLAINPPQKNNIHTAKLRWRIERDYQELKQEVGLGHYEERGWRGFDHHATLFRLTGFLVTIPPYETKCFSFEAAALSPNYRPHRAATTPRASRSAL